MPQRRQTFLVLVAALGLIYPASVRSELPHADPRYAFEVSLHAEFPIQLSLLIHLPPEPDDWTRLKSRAANAVANAELQFITGPAEIRQDGLWTWLEATDGKAHFKTSWVSPRVQLVPNQIYTFAVLFHPYTEPSVEKIFEEGRIIYDLSVCQVHGVQMGKEGVTIIFGDGPRNYYPNTHGGEPSFDTRMQLFPHYIEVTYGGCVVYPERTAMLYTCPKCRAAFTQWEQQHRTEQLGYFPNLRPFDNRPTLPVGFPW